MGGESDLNCVSIFDIVHIGTIFNVESFLHWTWRTWMLGQVRDSELGENFSNIFSLINYELP